MPTTSGVISELRAIAVFDAHAPGDRAKVLGVRTVRNTDERRPVETVYHVDATVPEHLNLQDGVWRDAGWLVSLDVSE